MPYISHSDFHIVPSSTIHLVNQNAFLTSLEESLLGEWSWKGRGKRLARDIVISKVRGIVKQTEVEKCYVNLFILKIQMFSKFALILRRGAKDLNLSK